MTTTPSADDLAQIIRSHRFNWSSENDLQRGLSDVLTQAGHTVQREAPLGSAGRIDLLINNVGIEVKAPRKGQATSAGRVAAQLLRYAQHEQITELILVSTTFRHQRMPAQLNGVTVTTINVGAGL